MSTATTDPALPRCRADDDLPIQPGQVYTTERRIETRRRCGENQTRGEWKVYIAEDYCAAPTASGRRLQAATDPDAGNRGMTPMDASDLEILEWVHLSSGSWYRIHMEQVHLPLLVVDQVMNRVNKKLTRCVCTQFDNLASDLLLDSLFVTGSISLNNDPAPSFNCTDEFSGNGCAPENPGIPYIFYKRALECALAFESNQFEPSQFEPSQFEFGLRPDSTS